MAKNQTLTERIEEIINPTVEGLGYLIWNVDFVKEGSTYVLRVTIDTPNGCDLDDCEKVSKAIDPILDEYDPIEQSYVLEVSSPGIEREIVKDWHYEQCIGEVIDVKLFSPDEMGVKQHTGILKTYTKDFITLLENDKEIQINNNKISKANIHFDYTEYLKKEGNNNE